MEAVNGVSELDKGGPPAPSPLTGCYLLIVVGEPHSKEHKDIILQRISKGLLSWDSNDCHVDLEKELAIITEQAPEGEDARYGERLIQFASENLVTEVLIHPAISTLTQCMKNLLSSFTRHRHIIHAGYTFAANGSWILQDGTFSLTDFSEAFQELEVQRVLRAYDNTISLDIHCSPEGDWSRLPKDSFSKNCKLRVNPDDVLTSGSPAIVNFLNYISPFLIPTDIEMLLESSDVVGNIRFSHPTLYVFPGGQGDAALFGINGFNMLVDGGFARKACFWDFVRHLDRLDAVLLTRLNNSNVNGISSVLRRKRHNTVYPQIGHFFCNIQERKAILSPDGDKDKDPLLVNLFEEGQDVMNNLRQLNLQPQSCYRDTEPINLYHKVGHGTLDMYILSPSRDSKEVREFLQKWNTNDQKLFANQRNGKEFTFPTYNLVSICALLVWQPANTNDNITRILFPGSSPQHKIFEGLDKIKQLECVKYAACSAKTLTPNIIKSKLSKSEKIIQEQKDMKLKPHPMDIKPKLENKIVEDNLKNGHTNGVTNNQIIPDKTIKKHDSTESDKSGPQSLDTKKPDTVSDVTNGKVIDEKSADKLKPKAKLDQKIKPDVKSVKNAKPTERKVKASIEKKASPTTPKKTVEPKINGDVTSRTKAFGVKTSPSATPAKSAKEANNRKVVESKYKAAPKRDISKQTEKKEVKPERKPISRRTVGASPIGKTPESPVRKISELHKVEARKPKLEKECTTDSSTVSTPSADVDSTMKKDLSKLTPEELEQIKEREMAELKEEQEVVKEIEAVFRKSETKPDNNSDMRKVKNISIDDKTEGDGEEYLIIEKEEIEHDSLDEKDVKESETQKHTRDSEESEKQRKLSDVIESTEVKVDNKEEIEKETPIPVVVSSKEDKESAKPISKDISVTSPDDKIEESSGKKITDKEHEDDNKDINVLESQPDEKYSTPIESGATTAPTLPEDERIPLDEIKEDNGDQVIEEKYVKEDTKEKEIPTVQVPPKSVDLQNKIPSIVGIRLDRQTPMRDIVKTPDEVADLPVHEVADIDNYEQYQSVQAQTPKQEEATNKDKVDEEKPDNDIVITQNLEKGKNDDEAKDSKLEIEKPSAEEPTKTKEDTLTKEEIQIDETKDLDTKEVLEIKESEIISHVEIDKLPEDSKQEKSEEENKKQEKEKVVEDKIIIDKVEVVESVKLKETTSPDKHEETLPEVSSPEDKKQNESTELAPEIKTESKSEEEKRTLSEQCLKEAIDEKNIDDRHTTPSLTAEVAHITESKENIKVEEMEPKIQVHDDLVEVEKKTLLPERKDDDDEKDIKQISHKVEYEHTEVTVETYSTKNDVKEVAKETEDEKDKDTTEDVKLEPEKEDRTVEEQKNLTETQEIMNDFKKEIDAIESDVIDLVEDQEIEDEIVEALHDVKSVIDSVYKAVESDTGKVAEEDGDKKEKKDKVILDETLLSQELKPSTTEKENIVIEKTTVEATKIELITDQRKEKEDKIRPAEDSLETKTHTVVEPKGDDIAEHPLPAEEVVSASAEKITTANDELLTDRPSIKSFKEDSLEITKIDKKLQELKESVVSEPSSKVELQTTDEKLPESLISELPATTKVESTVDSKVAEKSGPVATQESLPTTETGPAADAHVIDKKLLESEPQLAIKTETTTDLHITDPKFHESPEPAADVHIVDKNILETQPLSPTKTEIIPDLHDPKLQKSPVPVVSQEPLTTSKSEPVADEHTVDLKSLELQLASAIKTETPADLHLIDSKLQEPPVPVVSQEPLTTSKSEPVADEHTVDLKSLELQLASAIKTETPADLHLIDSKLQEPPVPVVSQEPLTTSKSEPVTEEHTVDLKSLELQLASAIKTETPADLHIIDPKLQEPPVPIVSQESLPISKTDIHMVDLKSLESQPLSVSKIDTTVDLHITDSKVKELPESVGLEDSLLEPTVDTHMIDSKLEKLPKPSSPKPELTADVHVADDNLKDLPEPTISKLPPVTELHIVDQKLQESQPSDVSDKLPPTQIEDAAELDIIENLEKSIVSELSETKTEPGVDLHLVDKKLQELQESDITDSMQSTKHESKIELDVVDKFELGRKSPKEREEDVAKIVASVAEVLKSDAPLEEFEGKIPLAGFNTFAPYPTELRETHITTLESPIKDIIVESIIMDPIEEEEKVVDPTTAFINEERRIAAVHIDHDDVKKGDEGRVSSLIKDSTELIQATTKMLSDIKQSVKTDDPKPEEHLNTTSADSVHESPKHATPEKTTPDVQDANEISSDLIEGFASFVQHLAEAMTQKVPEAQEDRSLEETEITSESKSKIPVPSAAVQETTVPEVPTQDVTEKLSEFKKEVNEIVEKDIKSLTNADIKTDEFPTEVQVNVSKEECLDTGSKDVVEHVSEKLKEHQESTSDLTKDEHEEHKSIGMTVTLEQSKMEDEPERSKEEIDTLAEAAIKLSDTISQVSKDIAGTIETVLQHKDVIDKDKDIHDIIVEEETKTHSKVTERKSSLPTEQEEKKDDHIAHKATPDFISKDSSPTEKDAKRTLKESEVIDDSTHTSSASLPIKATSPVASGKTSPDIKHLTESVVKEESKLSKSSVIESEVVDDVHEISFENIEKKTQKTILADVHMPKDIIESKDEDIGTQLIEQSAKDIERDNKFTEDAISNVKDRESEHVLEKDVFLDKSTVEIKEKDIHDSTDAIKKEIDIPEIVKTIDPKKIEEESSKLTDSVVEESSSHKVLGSVQEFIDQEKGIHIKSEVQKEKLSFDNSFTKDSDAEQKSSGVDKQSEQLVTGDLFIVSKDAEITSSEIVPSELALDKTHSGKSTPDIKNKSQLSSGKVSPELILSKDDCRDVETTSSVSEKFVAQVDKPEVVCAEESTLSQIASGRSSPEIIAITKDLLETKVSPILSRKSTPEIIVDNEFVVLDRLSPARDAIETDQKSSVTDSRDKEIEEHISQSTIEPTHSSVEVKVDVNVAEQSVESLDKSSSETKPSNIISVVETSSDTKDEQILSKAGPSTFSEVESIKAEETNLSRKSTPDIADVVKVTEKEELSLGTKTPPTAPVSPVVKDKFGSSHEKDVKIADIRSCTPASDDCDISSGQVSRVLTTEDDDEKQGYSDDEDIPGSPLSATSQIAHSTSSQYDFEDSVRGVTVMDPMSTSFYGALPDDPLDHGTVKSQDDIPTHSSPSHVYEITTAKYTSLNLQSHEGEQSKIVLPETDIMSASFIGSELPTETKDDPIASWSKPLGLPSPAPINDNKGTPKKERKIPSNVVAKNKLNEDKKNSESKFDRKGKKMNPVYVDLTYVPHNGNSNYSYVDFFKRIRARYYVFSGIEPSKDVYNALLEAKQTWDDKDLEVTIIPTYDTDVLGYWVAENEEILAKYKIDLSPSASRCTINLQDHETSCSAYRLEFS